MSDICRASIALALALMSMTLTSRACAASSSSDSLEVEGCEYGEVHQFSDASCTITLTNRGDEPLDLSITAVQPGNKAVPDAVNLAAHRTAKIKAELRLGPVSGRLSWSFRVEGAGDEPKFAQASGFVTSVLDDPHPGIDFGSLDSTDLPKTRSLELRSSLDPSFRVARVISSPQFIDARIGPDGKTLVCTMAADAPWGPLDEVIKLAIDAPMQKEAWIGIAGDVEGDVGPEKNPYWFGGIPWKKNRTLTVPLFDKEGRDFSIGKITSADLDATFGTSDCKPAKPGCKDLLIHVADAQPPGFFKSRIDVPLTDRKRQLTLVVWGIFGGPAQPGGHEESAPPPGMSKLSLPSPEKNDDAPPPPLMVQPEPTGAGPLLRWVVRQQQGVYGYQIFRGDSAKGPFALMNATMLPKLENGGGPVKYQWRDTTAIKGRTYWYYIAVVYKSGSRKALSEPRKATATEGKS